MTHLCTITEDLEGPSATLCDTCKRLLPDAVFKRRSTHAQAHARGFTRPGDVTYEIWKDCTDCSPPAKRATVRTMTSHRIMQEIRKGNLRASVAGPAIEQARRRENEQRRQGVLRRWDNEWANRWHYARERLRFELAATTQRIYYARDNPHRDDPDGAVEAFLLVYRQRVRETIHWCTMQARNRAGREEARRVRHAESDPNPQKERRRGRPRKPAPPGRREYVMDRNSQWTDYIPESAMQKLRSLFIALPTRVRVQRLGQPPLLLLAGQDSLRFCLHDFNAEDEAFNEALQARTTGVKKARGV